MSLLERILSISQSLSKKIIEEKIFHKKSNESLTQEINSFANESDRYKSIIDEYNYNDKIYNKIIQIKEFNESKAWEKVRNAIKIDDQSKFFFSKKIKYYVFATVATSIIIFILFYKDFIYSPWNLHKETQSQNLIIPDPCKLMIMTNCGNIIFLDNTSESIDINTIIKDYDIKIFKQFDFYPFTIDNSLIVPYGSTCNIKISDGTLIHLNSGSILKFPSEFNNNSREVTLIGEAYFDVAHDKQKPFIVKTSKFLVKVVGTSFDISCYNDETSVKVTLEKGSVKILGINGNNEYATLMPNHQMQLNKDERMRIIPVNPTLVTSWKEGVFIFENETMEEITKKLEKIYNINIIIKDEEIKSLKYYAYFKRYQNPTEVFDILRMTKEIDYSVNNNVLTIFSYGEK